MHDFDYKIYCVYQRLLYIPVVTKGPLLNTEPFVFLSLHNKLKQSEKRTLVFPQTDTASNKAAQVTLLSYKGSRAENIALPHKLYHVSVLAFSLFC